MSCSGPKFDFNSLRGRDLSGHLLKGYKKLLVLHAFDENLYTNTHLIYNHGNFWSERSAFDALGRAYGKT